MNKNIRNSKENKGKRLLIMKDLILHMFGMLRMAPILVKNDL